MSTCGACRRCGWHLKVHRKGRLRGLIVIAHGCVPRGKKRYTSRGAALAEASKKARKTGSWMLAGIEE